MIRGQEQKKSFRLEAPEVLHLAWSLLRRRFLSQHEFNSIISRQFMKFRFESNNLSLLHGRLNLVSFEYETICAACFVWQLRQRQR